MIELQGLITHMHKCISVLLQVSLNVHWSVSLYFFCVYICLYKKAYHLPPDQPLPMAPPPLMPPPLLPPLLLPSPRPSLQVSAGFSCANLPTTPLPHFPTLSVSCCYHHLTAATQACPPPLYPVMVAVTARPTVWLCPLSCPPLLFIWIDARLHDGKRFGLKSIISLLDWNGIGEGNIIRLFGTLFANTVTICNQFAVHYQPITPPTHAQLCISPSAFLESILP